MAQAIPGPDFSAKLAAVETILSQPRIAHGSGKISGFSNGIADK
jgi:hypothetical protein